jgi:alpha-1,3-rhamnosyl/mannosyltransferase
VAPLPITIALAAVAHARTPGCSRLERAVDLYHSTDYMVPRLRCTPVVATVYDAIPIVHPQWANQRLRRFKNWLLKQSVRNADRVIAISEAGRDEIVSSYGIRAERIRVIPLGIDGAWLEPVDERAMQSTLLRRKLEPGYFLFVGTLQPRKNVEALLDAYGRAAGNSSSGGWSSWESTGGTRKPCQPRGRAPAESLRGSTTWRAGALSSTPEPDVVFPSLAEGFGLPILKRSPKDCRCCAICRYWGISVRTS